MTKHVKSIKKLGKKLKKNPLKVAKKVVKQAGHGVRTWGPKIADARGAKWHKNMLAGKRDAQLNPSLIRLARLKKGIAQSELAKKMVTSLGSFGEIERGRRLVKEVKAQTLAKALGLPLEKIFKLASGTKSNKKFVAIRRAL
jgi:ribosome-binding protein aMBF1 (putative translation factor)